MSNIFAADSFMEIFGFRRVEMGTNVEEKGERMQEYVGYEKLLDHLLKAYDQAAIGKGNSRHANSGQPFHKQDICEINRRIGSFDGPLYQAIKKAIESKRILKQISKQAAIQELYGAINYLVAACILIGEMPDYVAENCKK